MATKKHLGDLPEGLITKVLIRLPVKSLLICKCVCKPWLSTISNPNFVKSHIHHSITTCRNDPTLLNIINVPQLAFLAIEPHEYSPYPTPAELQQQQLQRRRRHLINQALDDANRQDLSESPLQFGRVALPGPFQMTHFIGCCNGIICLSSYNYVVYLWNPSVKMFRKLHLPNPRRSVAVTVGFGYDSISDEYKILRLVYMNENDVVPIANVYHVNEDSSRQFQGPTLTTQIYNFWPSPSNIVVNGVLYFDGGDQLVTFDLHDEVFGLVPFPNSVQRKRSDVMDFEGYVAVVFESGTGVDLWTFDKVEFAWTKKFSIDYGIDDLDVEIKLSCYLGAKQFYGEKSLYGNYFVHEILYDYEKKETKYYGLREEYVNIYAASEESEMHVRAMLEDSIVPVHAAFRFTETLVSLSGFEPVGDAKNQIL
ncbi:hypothetical protein POM88_008855 [Heracleum sosnowskyi]|uniref:F-box domain-containing protein n=1 Tax=Heracleum sosnowskyi TaxID=360622 RepID=A0AAD8J786_9APIA|nr:hypothetical protein POM88_008855 [Heracleum sosnowskyi]